MINFIILTILTIVLSGCSVEAKLKMESKSEFVDMANE